MSYLPPIHPTYNGGTREGNLNKDFHVNREEEETDDNFWVTEILRFYWAATVRGSQFESLQIWGELDLRDTVTSFELETKVKVDFRLPGLDF